MWARIWSLATKEFIQLVRDRLMLTFLLLLPVLQLVLLAQATGQGVRRLSLAVADLDQTALSRGLIQAFDNVPELTWRYAPTDVKALSALVENGQAVAGVVIPSGFGAALTAGRTVPPLQILVDGSNTVTAATAQSALERVLNAYAVRLARDRGWAAASRIELRTDVRFNPGLNARLFTIPAQLGFIVYQVTLAVASLTLARERELGTLEQLLVMPLRRFELIIGKAVLAWLIGGLDFLLMYAVVVYGFAIPMRGAFSLLLGCSLLFIAVEIGYGVIISSLARTQQQAILYVFLLAMLDVALSGYLVPVKNMPALFQAAAQASPLQHYLVIVRGIMLKGADLPLIWPQVAAIAAIGGVVGLIALQTATKRLE
ncbi:MAG: ABC transporter permease [Anaerolineae bacterium]